ncbi:Hypothetical predicted protein [Octopus vulgaris]|uniref:Uncharacterized protein n=1 Tax=Octopus vulgaris TaxID=6645 RepID=A0AA36EZT4_OCTVU|nr:Hypothetical predicted protein [Octopus vulgaris]
MRVRGHHKDRVPLIRIHTQRKDGGKGTNERAKERADAGEITNREEDKIEKDRTQKDKEKKKSEVKESKEEIEGVISPKRRKRSKKREHSVENKKEVFIS